MMRIIQGLRLVNHALRRAEERLAGVDTRSRET